ncbi:unnamed protein product [Toxocara canis]|uniref:UBX domain-containing protein n=1 Tax=Toxocara canis TaxID=6265 RepID=A0A183V1R1_TOXCA|nr:unnamed protein product [Toxocara canis]
MMRAYERCMPTVSSSSRREQWNSLAHPVVHLSNALPKQIASVAIFHLPVHRFSSNSPFRSTMRSPTRSVCHISPQLSPREGTARYEDYQRKSELSSVDLSMDDTVKVEADDKLQMEDEGDDEEVATTSARVRHRRECAEVAKKKLRLDLRPNELKNALEQNSVEVTIVYDCLLFF